MQSDDDLHAPTRMNDPSFYECCSVEGGGQNVREARARKLWEIGDVLYSIWIGK